MSNTKKKYVLSLVIILGLLIVTAMPLILQSNQKLFPLQPNTLANIETNLIPPKQNPQTVNLWWNYSWNYRIQVNVREPGYVNRINETAVVRLNFTSGHCANNSIRVLYYYSSTARWVEVPIQLENLTYSGANITGCDLIFLCNVTRGGTSTYYVYYNDSYTGDPPTYTTPLNVTIVGTSYFTFDTGIISGNYTIRYSNTSTDSSYFDDDASFRIFKVNGTNIIPINGQHSGIDRIEGDDPYRVSGNQLNWVADFIEDGPIRAIVRVSKSSTDAFASEIGGGSYGSTNKTYTFFAYQSYVSVSVNSTAASLPVYDFAAVSVTNQWKLYIDTYDLGVATDYPWVDLLSSPQPYNYMSLVRNDGFGLGLLGSMKWPVDTYVYKNRTSMEYGFGYVDPGVSSFFFRNDGRDPNEYNISVPFTYYIVGLTKGFNQVRDTWYQANQTLRGTIAVGERSVFYPLIVNVTDNFSRAISGAIVSVYNNQSLTSLNTSGTTNSQGLVTFYLNKNYTADQYWIRANVSRTYKNYGSDPVKWNPIVDFTPPTSTLNISMNITIVYVEVWDNANHRDQNANVTLNYTNGLGNISQMVDPFYASCTFYAWANQYLNIDIYNSTGKEEIFKIYQLFPNGTRIEVTQPINTNQPKSFRVEINRNIAAFPSQLSSNVTLLTNIYWKDNATFYVWLNRTDTGAPINADWINFTIYNSTGGTAIPSPINMTLVQQGLYYYTFNTSTVGGSGLLGGDTYTITITAVTNSSYLNPTPISIYLQLQNIPVEAFSPYGIDNPIEIEWYESLSDFVTISVRLTDVHNNLRLDAENISYYTITDTIYVNQTMEKWASQGTGWYKVPNSVVDDLRPGDYIVNIESSMQNYTISSKSIRLIINLAPSKIIFPFTDVQGSYNDDIQIYAQFLRPGVPPASDTPITGALMIWYIQGTNATGEMTDPFNTGNYSGQILKGTVPSGSYVLIIQATKENYNVSRQYINLNIKGASTTLASAILIPQLFGSSEFLFAGPLVQVENSWIVAPVSFTYVDSNGNPVPNTSITVKPGLPVFDLGRGTIKGVGGSQVGALQIGAGSYLVLVPTFGLPPGTYMISILAQATNYQAQQIPIVLSIKERAIPLGPGIRVPVSVFLITLAAVAIPTTLFITYTFLQRARIPYLIKRIDELIRAISRGEKVTVKLVPREKVIADLLGEELAIVGVEPRMERYIPVELADLIVPLLVESGMQEKEAHVMALELKTATPGEREKLLESVGIPGETSARIIQKIEEFEEKQVTLRKPPRPAGEEPTEEPHKDEEPEKQD